MYSSRNDQIVGKPGGCAPIQRSPNLTDATVVRQLSESETQIGSSQMGSRQLSGSSDRTEGARVIKVLPEVGDISGRTGGARVIKVLPKVGDITGHDADHTLLLQRWVLLQEPAEARAVRRAWRVLSSRLVLPCCVAAAVQHLRVPACA